MTDGIGRVTDRIEYSAYGMITFRTGSTDTPFLFNGRYGVQTDASGILYMRARYYNPYLCRFVNADPAGFAGGLNFYAYADGNPVSRIDPFGLGAAEPGYRSSSWFQITQSGVWGAEEGIDAMLNFGLGILFAPPGMPGPRIDPIQSLTEWATGHSAYEPSDLGGQMKQTSAQLVPAGQDVLLSLGGQRPEVKPSAPVLDPKQIYPRYEYSESWKQELADYHSSDGKLFDVTGVEIKPGDYWEVGHAGPTYAERVRNAIDQAMSREEWQAQEHDVRLFRPELRYTNRSRRFQNWTGPGEQTIPGL